MKEVVLTHSKFKRRRGVCPVCEKERAVTRDGWVDKHRAADGIGTCEGWGTSAKDDTIFIPRPGP